ncbi:MAG: DUF4738 domain-containing protein [Bacteroidaceae bacterium]|nr:DUF4738 domain-containing protein [Bacteroidaceae bacterium]
MKRQLLGASTLVFLLLMTLSSCKGKSTTSQDASPAGEFETEDVQSGSIQCMRSYDYTDTLTVNGHCYEYTIHREADESLPMVTDDEGVNYADNRYTLTILRDGQSCFDRQFTKANFASYLTPEFRERGILDGMMCDRSLPGLCFALSVTLPQSDMVEPLLLRIDPAGGLVIESDTRSENDFEE